MYKIAGNVKEGEQRGAFVSKKVCVYVCVYECVILLNFAVETMPNLI